MTERSVKAIVRLIWGFILYFLLIFVLFFVLGLSNHRTSGKLGLAGLIVMCVSVSDRVECGTRKRWTNIGE